MLVHCHADCSVIIFYLLLLLQLQSEESLELQHIMEEMSKMFGGRRRGTEWSVPWPYKGRTVVNLLTS